MRLVVIAIAALISCDATVADFAPDAGGPTVEAIWDPRVCGRDPRGRIQIRLVDTAGVVVGVDGVCGQCRLDVTVPHVGWYWATALAFDDELGGHALATSTIAVDAAVVRWRIEWE